MNIKSNKWELIQVINKVNCEESVLKFTLESCVCVCIYYTHVNICGSTARSEAFTTRHNLCRTEEGAALSGHSLVYVRKFRHKNATHVITKQYHNYLTLLKTKDAQNGVADFSLYWTCNTFSLQYFHIFTL